MGIEPTYPAWKAGVLPLNYARKKYGFEIITFIKPLVKNFAFLLYIPWRGGQSLIAPLQRMAAMIRQKNY